MKLSISIQGMHCRACEVAIQKNLETVPEIKNSRANFRRQTVAVYFDGAEPSADEIKKAIESAGYKIGASKKLPWLSREAREYRQFFMAAVIFGTIYFLIWLFGLTNLNFNLGQSASYPIILLVGLTAGVSTCMALIGGLVLGFAASYSEKHAGASFLGKFKPHLFFNLGRVLGFFVLGGSLGAAGAILNPSARLSGFLILAAALMMLILGLRLINIFPKIAHLQLTVPSWLGGKIFGRTEYTPLKTFLSGVLTFFLPCGFTQAVQLVAISSASFLAGGLIMSLFALGTAPGLLGLGAISSGFKGAKAQIFFKLAGLAVIAFGLININNGLVLTGLKSASASADEKISLIGGVKIIGGTQIVKMEQWVFGYKPNHFQIKKNLPVRWLINSTNPYTCASSLVVPSLDIAQPLSAGQNVIEFTPNKIGRINFSCGMGMYRGYFEVIE